MIVGKVESWRGREGSEQVSEVLINSFNSNTLHRDYRDNTCPQCPVGPRRQSEYHLRVNIKVIDVLRVQTN